MGSYLDNFSKTFFYEVNLAWLCSNLEVFLISKLCSEREVLVFFDPQGYKVSCCGRFSLDFFFIIQLAVIIPSWKVRFTDDSLSLVPSLPGGFFMISFKLYINLSRSMADRLLRLTNCNKGTIYVVCIRDVGRSKKPEEPVVIWLA